MREIIKGVNVMATGELLRANKDNPLFHSNHEAFGVIDEEVEEVNTELENMLTFRKFFRNAVHRDCEEEQKEYVIKLRKAAMLCACEAIQVVAMCDKYFMGKEAQDDKSRCW